jgi:hypothetical protein
MSQSSTTKIIPSCFFKWWVVRSTTCKCTSAARWSKCHITHWTSDVQWNGKFLVLSMNTKWHAMQRVYP